MMDDVRQTTMCNAKFSFEKRAFSIFIHTFNKQIFALNIVISAAHLFCCHYMDKTNKFSQALTIQCNGRQRRQRMTQTEILLLKQIRILPT
jgi:hypothetical protein